MIIAQDSFNRTVASGSWGSADVGGAWALSGGATEFSVGSSKGTIALQPSYNRIAYLGGVSSTNTITRVSMSSSVASTGGGAQNFTISGRRITDTENYQARIRIESGSIYLFIMKNDTSSLASATSITHTYAPNEVIWCELAVTGVNPTTVAAKIWLDGSSEPVAYQQSTTDSSVGYQIAGPVGLRSSLNVSASSAVHSFDNYTVEDPTTSVLATPVVSLVETPPTTIGGSDGSITATWAAVSGADHYESCLKFGTATSGFVADDTNAISPKTYSGLVAGDYTVAVRAKAS